MAKQPPRIRRGRKVTKARAIADPARKHRRPRRTRRGPRIRKNPPGETVLVWIWPDGGTAKIPKGKNHRTAVPGELGRCPGPGSPAWFAAAARKGYFRGMIVNQRLYVECCGPSSRPSAGQVKKLRQFARAEGLSRGIVIEKFPDRL
jgi:hypothetical protein